MILIHQRPRLARLTSETGSSFPLLNQMRLATELASEMPLLNQMRLAAELASAIQLLSRTCPQPVELASEIETRLHEVHSLMLLAAGLETKLLIHQRLAKLASVTA